MHRSMACGLALWLGAAGGGCLKTETVTRSQASDDLAETEAVATVGAKTEVGNVEPIPVHGVGYVHNLSGTGSIPAADGWRTMLEQALRKQKYSPKELLDDSKREHSLVLISGQIPPGARAGDRYDIAVALPPTSKTTSLKGGVLLSAEMTNAELAGSAREAMQSAGMATDKSATAPADNTLLLGSRLGVADGPLVAGFDAATTGPQSGDGPRAGRIWGGGRVLIDRPYYFLLNDNTPQTRLAMVVAERLNAVFQAAGDTTGKLAEAKVQSNRPLVMCRVPPGYRLNHRRFLTVARQVPLVQTPGESSYRRQLENDLLRPETCLTAAVKLEALGSDSRQALRVGLQSDSLWVRFASAEALAYLGHADGAADLAELAQNHAAVRTQCLTALSSLDDASCTEKLAELMAKPDATLRYGAFVALRHADAQNPAIKGRHCNGSFWLHSVAEGAPPMVHVSSQGRAEVVLFGGPFVLRTPFSFGLGRDYVVSAQAGYPTVKVGRVTSDNNGEPTTLERICPADLGNVLQTLAALGAGYSEVVECVRKVQVAEVVEFPVVFDAAPRGLSLPQLAVICAADPTMTKADDEVQRAGSADAGGNYNLPSTLAEPAPKPAAPSADLAREPGRIFSPKKAPSAPEPTPIGQ